MPGPKHSYCIYLAEEERSALKHLSLSYTEPYTEVVRARILLLSHDHPEWSIRQIANKVGCTTATVKKFRRRWVMEGSFKSHPRPGAPRRYQATLRARVTALACSRPADHGKPWQRWSCGKLAQVAHEEGMSDSISRGTVCRWLREDRIKPWRYHSWQKPTDP
jgi:transposase